MKSLAHICNGPAIPGEMLALGSFLGNRLCTKPHMTDGKRGRRRWIEYIRKGDRVRCIFMGWAFLYIAVFVFAANSLCDEIFKIFWACVCGRLVPSICRRNSGCREQNNCRTAAIQHAWGKGTLPDTTVPPIAMESPQMSWSPLLRDKTSSMDTLSRL